MNDSQSRTPEIRQKGLQEEIRELADVVSPVSLVDLLLERSFQLNATDIHLDPTPEGLRVRLRLDGLMHDIVVLPMELVSPVTSRIKLLADMDITERRFAQDGHFSNESQGSLRDVRVGSGPTIHGERIVMRLIPDPSRLVELGELGFEPEQMELLSQILDDPFGMVLSVGPVGSGKSTTIYACLNILNQPTRSVLTIEDPVERRLSGVTQIQVDSRIDFQFGDALKGVLRQDPNVIMVGEIRDSETAHTSVRAGLTGITVLSTMHANETTASFDVFREFEIPAMFVGDAMRCVVAQRLIRKLCQHCRRARSQTTAERQWLAGFGGTESNVYDPVGCEQCFGTGYAGRTGVFEVLVVNETLRAQILKESGRTEIRRVACEAGMISLEQACQRKVLDGTTSVQEMHRVLSSFPD